MVSDEKEGGVGEGGREGGRGGREVGLRGLSPWAVRSARQTNARKTDRWSRRTRDEGTGEGREGDTEGRREGGLVCTLTPSARRPREESSSLSSRTLKAS